MKLAIAVAPQPEFPHEDVCVANADHLEVMLENSILLEAFHQTAEQIVGLYRTGHAAIQAAEERLYLSGARQLAFDHGVQVYEALAVLLANSPDCNAKAMLVNASALRNEIDGFTLAGYVQDAADRFTDEQPNAADLVLECSRRYHANLADYALKGAALARQFEIDSTGALEAPPQRSCND
jgi:hypothetical protein